MERIVFVNRKVPLGITISLIAIGCAITFVLTWTVSLNIYNSKITSSDKYEGLYEKLQEMDAVVRTNYIGQIDDETLEFSIVNGYVNGVGDKYASYMQANTYYELRQTTSGVVNGAGLEVEEDGSGYLKVTQIYKGGSAESNGVKVGDIITTIDGRSLLSMEPGTLAERISGEIGTKLTLHILRGGEEADVTLVRQQVDIESVTGNLLDNGIGYIKIDAFNEKTPEQFSTTLNTLTEQNIKALIIDIRQNGGGIVTALQPMLNRIIPAGAVAYAEYAGGARRTLIETDSIEKLEMPIAILVDNGTASAAELFAAVLRGESGAFLVGTQTYGKAVMQNTYEFSDGSALTLSTATIVPAKEPVYDGTGLKPDYLVELTEGSSPEYVSPDNDTQLQKAIEVLTPKVTVE